MRKIAISLLTVLCFAGISGKATYSDRTFLTPRSLGSNLPMEYTTWHRMIHHDANAKYNGALEAVGFYQESDHKAALGKYFGFLRSGAISDIFGVSPTVGTNKYTEVLNSNDIIHNFKSASRATANTIKGSYKLRPNQTAYGLKLFYHQDLDKLVDGLFLRVNAPIVNVKNDMGLSVETALTSQGLPVTTGDNVALSGTSVNFLDYLAGKVQNSDASNIQAPLKYAKLTGGSHSSTGVADVDISLGYTFTQKKHYRGAFLIDLLIPTGKTPKAEYLFEPVHGNGHHWGIGAGIDCSINLWKANDKALTFMLVAKYNYLFDGIEKRTLRFTRANGTKSAANNYFQAGEKSKSGVFPMANILTQDLRVTPGSVFDGIAALTFIYGGFTFDLGYNLYAKDSENLSLKNPWENDKYAEADWSYRTNAVFDTKVTAGTTGDPLKAYAYEGAPVGTNAAIQASMLDLDAAKSPSQVTHKIYGGLGYEFRRNTYPMLLGLGGSYEYSENNSALEGWAIWGKFGISW